MSTKLLLLLITLTTLTNVSYASFPFAENNTYEVFAINLEDPDEDDNEPSLIVFILRGILLAAIFSFWNTRFY